MKKSINRYCSIWLTAFIVWMCVCTTHAQQWSVDYDSAKVAFNNGNCSMASKQLDKILSSHRKKIPDSTVAEIHMLLGMSYMQCKENKQAGTALNTAINMYQKLGLTHSDQFFHLLNSTATLEYRQKNYSAALILFSSLTKIIEEGKVMNPEEELSIYYNTALCASQLSKWDVCIASLTKWIKIAEIHSVPVTPSVSQYLGHAYLLSNELNNAETWLKKAESTIDLEKSMSIYSQNKADIIALYLAQQKVELAATIASEWAKNAPEEHKVAATNSLVNIRIKQGNYITAEKLLVSLLSSIKNNTLSKTSIQLSLASLYRIKGQFNEAETLYQSALKDILTRVDDSHLDVGSIYNNMALLYKEKGEYDRANQYFEKDERIILKHLGEHNAEYAKSLNNRASLYQQMGKYQQAEALFTKSLSLRESLFSKNHPEYANTLNNLASLYQKLGRLTDSRKKYIEAYAILSTHLPAYHPDISAIQNNLGSVYEQEGNLSEASKYYKLSLESTKISNGENSLEYSTRLNNLALLEQKKGDFVTAEKYYLHFLQTSKKLGNENTLVFASAIRNLGRMYENTGKYAEADKQYKIALSIREKLLNKYHPDLNRSYIDLAHLNTALNNHSQAIHYWQKGIDNYLYQINTYFPSMSEKEKEAFYSEISKSLEQFFSYASTNYSKYPILASMMYNYRLSTKALLLSNTNGIRTRILRSNDQELVTQYKQWLSLREQIGRQYQLSNEDLSNQKARLDSLEQRANELEKMISSRSEAFKKSRESRTYTWKDIQKNIKEGECAVEIVRFPNYRFERGGVYTDTILYTYLFVDKKAQESPDVFVNNKGVWMETEVLKFYRNTIRFGIADNHSYNLYWKPIREKTSTISKLYISGDGVYHQINLNCLKNPDNNRYVLDECDIFLVTNTREIIKPIFLFSKPSTKKEAVLMGNPLFEAPSIESLPGTKEEIQKISSTLSDHSWQIQSTLGVDSKERFVKQVNSPQILHIATHGYFLSEDDDSTKTNPTTLLLQSGLLFTDTDLSDEDDGILTAYEAMNLNLENTELVVLSACETGLGKTKNGEGVYGLERAFRIAGAQSLILSLWKVSDQSTHELMSNFYKEWLSGKSKASAFKIAQRNLREKYPQPIHWGGFILIGE